jgi:hypothetical protein
MCANFARTADSMPAQPDFIAVLLASSRLAV